ncbi:MAG: WecB/TagA/CpsF family glycosyltransferase [Planctomycetia bacterium]|jgi:N-acetylglucosaminyldiphosphoundecaprenol N-acetyl-beta-D-mannosaminyltransferase|nr:WecB/TagA/CpsF family glycosyltransferase [Planctomycetia bacterium]OQZ02574.1 MAG: hypothetical protein B6D36_13290 [Planctomycetes bacterium UTPLA1]
MKEAISEIPRRELFGISVHAVTMSQTLALCGEAIIQKEQLSIGVVNVAKLVAMRRDRALHESVSSADLVLADGAGVVWAARLLGQPLPERVAGIDLFEKLLDLANERRASVYFLGARPAVLQKVVNRARRERPSVLIAGSCDGYYKEDEERFVAEKIRDAHPDILFVAMSSPKKEVFLKRWGSKLNVCVCHGVGGSFDVYAGLVTRAPLSWQKSGLEWLHRALQEPRRLWRRYLVTNCAFAVMLLREVALSVQSTWRRKHPAAD